MAGLYHDTSAPVVADSPIAAPNTVSTAVAHAAQIVPVGLATLNEDKTPDGVKTGFYLDFTVVTDTNAASTAVAHAAQIVPIGLAAFNEDETPDGVKSASGSYYIALPHGHTRLPQIPFIGM